MKTLDFRQLASSSRMIGGQHEPPPQANIDVNTMRERTVLADRSHCPVETLVGGRLCTAFPRVRVNVSLGCKIVSQGAIRVAPGVWFYDRSITFRVSMDVSVT